MRILVIVVILLISCSCLFAGTKVVITTNMGEIELELYDKKAPITVKNFLKYVDKSFYDGTIFHRVISDFMIQGGGFTADLNKKSTSAPIKNEADNGLANEEGSVAMARLPQKDTASSQFFINLKNNSFLNHRGKSESAYGYAVFARVIKGMPVVKRIKKVKTGQSKGMANVPQSPVVIKSIKRK